MARPALAASPPQAMVALTAAAERRLDWRERPAFPREAQSLAAAEQGKSPQVKAQGQAERVSAAQVARPLVSRLQEAQVGERAARRPLPSSG